MRVALLLLSFVVGVYCTSEETYENEFVLWMKKYSKSYLPEEFFERYAIFKNHYDEVQRHNAGNFTWRIGLNQFSDLTREEFKAKYLHNSERPQLKGDYVSLEDLRAMNKGPNAYPNGAVNWTAKGIVTPVKDQGQCGACWAFATTGGVESLVAMVHGTLTSLSEQELVDCAGEFGGSGCEGGSNDIGFGYAQKYGLCTEKSYPYTASDGSCKRSSCSMSANTQIKTWNHVPHGDDGLGAALDLQPVSIGIDADYWGSYESGVFCGTCGTSRDHAMLVVGYGTDSKGGPYFTVKNSWGTGWGEDGYIRLCRETKSDECGVSDDGTQPVYS